MERMVSVDALPPSRVLDRLFTRPYEVTQFWANDRLRSHVKPNGDGLVGRLIKEEPKAGRWTFTVEQEEGGPFVGEEIAPFLPTRANIIHLHDECRRASAILRSVVDAGHFEWPKGEPPLLAGLARDSSLDSLSLSSNAYKDVLWHTLAKDWGLLLPPLSLLGKRK